MMPAERDRLRRMDPRLLMGLVLLLAALLRVAMLQRHGLWTDEFKTLKAVELPLRAMLAERLHNGHWPPYFLITWAWTQLAGTAEWSLRLPSLLCGLGCIAYGMLIARAAWGWRAALFAGGLMTVHSRALWASLEARPYALIMLASLGALHALLCALRTRKRRWWAAWIAWSALGIFTHGTYPFILLLQVLILTLWFARTGRWGHPAVVIGLGLAALSVVAGFVISRFNQGTGFFTPPAWPGVGFVQDVTIEAFVGQWELLLPSPFKYLAVALILLTAWFGLRSIDWSRWAQPPIELLALGLVFGTIVGLTLVSGLVQGTSTAGVRYYIVGLGGAVLLMTRASTMIEADLGRRLYRLACLTLLGAGGLGYLVVPEDQVREGIRYVAERHGGEPVVFIAGEDAPLMTRYYALGVEPWHIGRSRRDIDDLRALIAGPLGQTHAFWVLEYKGEDTPPSNRLHDWARDHYRRTDQTRFEKVRIRHYERRP